MTGRRAIENRRHEPRQYLPKAPVAWCRHGTTVWRRGWMNDISTSGASLLVSMEGQPHAGQEIDLRPRYGGEALLCRVVRTQIGEGGRGLVACRVVSAGSCPALLRPEPIAEPAREQTPRGAKPPGLWVHGLRDTVRRKSACLVRARSGSPGRGGMCC
jgi:hypothetical protein